MKPFLITWTALTTLALTSNSITTAANNTNSITNCSLSLVKIANIEKQLNYQWNDSYNWFWSIYNDYSSTYTIVKWTDYAKDWNTFTASYPTFNFDSNSYLKVTTSNGKEDNKFLNLQVATTKIKVAQQKDIVNSLFTVSINTWPSYDPNSPGGTGNAIEIYLMLWHDNNNIYWKWKISNGTFLGSTSYANIKLNNIIFNNQK